MKRNLYGDLEPKMPYRSKQKRERYSMAWRIFWLTVSIAIIAFLAIRYAHAMDCAKVGGYYEQTICANDKCCEVENVTNFKTPWMN